MRRTCPPVGIADLAGVAVGTIVGDGSVTVTGLTQDSREVAAGDLFCCVRGRDHDGHDHAEAAVAAGAIALLVDHPVGVAGVAQIVVDDVRRVLGAVASRAFGDPSARLRVVGVTGTNGKTSTVAILAAILSAAGERCEVVGTLTGERTTPEAIDLQATLRAMLDSGATAVAMEVSSHALVMHRVDGVRFERAVFTNLSRDHLDLHGDMESYFAAKAMLFEEGRAQACLVNADDAWGRRLLASCGGRATGFSPSSLGEVTVAASTVAFSWEGRRVEVPIGGRFTVENALAAVVTARSMGVDIDAVVEGCAAVSPIAGRFETVPNDQGITVVVDYAHTPDGLSSLLATARTVCDGRVLLVFGCGGDRDTGKRGPMGEAGAAADVVWVTSDNPRGEDPVAIAAAVAEGVVRAGGAPIVEIDRRRAIESAILASGRGDMVVIAGKGHEKTQEIAGVQHPFADTEVAAAALERRKGGGA